MPKSVPLDEHDFEELEAWLRDVAQQAGQWADRLESNQQARTLRGRLDALALVAGNNATLANAFKEQL